ncbi:MAG: tRNA dihydrouridine synthase DusB, partial [Firmicutes bacterium]|nr:tRNA dihydrouridine synthase DusB [Bacillota bacterium]
NGIEKLNIPVGIQIFGSEPKTMAQASKILCEHFHQIKLIDINMGCPVPKVALRAQAGSSLLKYPDKIKEIVSAVVESVSVPVTVKIRSGWDSNSINAVEVAKIIEKAGASAITVHPRTRAQGYSGNADWNIIKQVKEAVSIPVIGNGDIKTIYDAEKMLKETNCDAIMIGRGALGNPWFIKEVYEYIEKGNIIDKPTYIDKINMAIKHLNLLLEYNNEKKAILEMRSNICYYLKGIPNSTEIKKEIFKVITKKEFIGILEDFKKTL